MCELGKENEQNVTRPPAASETRWAGILPQIAWCNEHQSVLCLYKKDPAKNCVENEDGTTVDKYFFDDYDRLLIGDLDAVLRPVGPFISTMEATEKVTSSLVIPMVMAILHATNETTPVLRYAFSFGELSNEDVIGHAELCQEVNAVRKCLYAENKSRFITNERVGHSEDNMICTILDPRFKLMNFNGCTAEMKSNAEFYLRENYKADWAPNRKVVDPEIEENDDAPVEKSVPEIFKKDKNKVRMFSNHCL